jgi:hypothetical protein
MGVDSAFVMAKPPKRPPPAPGQESPRPFSPETPVAENGRDRVAERAYELYQQRGGTDGGDMEDWLTAEREVGSNRDSDPHGG